MLNRIPKMGCFLLGLQLFLCANSHAAEEKQRPPTQVLIKNVHVWDGTSDGVSQKTNVLVEGNLIKKLGATDRDAEDNATVINGAGRVLMPGIIEAHGHLSLPVRSADINRDKDWLYIGAAATAFAQGYLMRGWTTVRDMGGPSQGLKRAIDDGIVPGPRIYTSGPLISQTSGHGDFRENVDPNPNMVSEKSFVFQKYSFIADGPAEVYRAVRESLRLGAVQIKMMAGGGISSDYDPIDSIQYRPEELRAGVQAAADWNTYVGVHAYKDEAIRRAIEAGVKTIEHGNLLEEDTARLMAEKGVWLSPQAHFFTMPDEELENLAASVGPSYMKKYFQVSHGLDTALTYAKKHGIKVAFGTDTNGDLSMLNALGKEFTARLKWFTPVEVLKQATSLNAELLTLSGPRNPYQDGPLGVVVEGAYADLLIINGNPIENIRLLEDPEKNLLVIMKDGKIYKNTL